jgi:hypothetical protein
LGRRADPLLGEVEEFLTGVRTAPEPDRVLATILRPGSSRAREPWVPSSSSAGVDPQPDGEGARSYGTTVYYNVANGVNRYIRGNWALTAP